MTVTDRAQPVRAAHIDEAAEHLIRARVTHLDNLAERPREPRAARILPAVLLGEGAEILDRRQDDFRYAVDLGLLEEAPGGLAPANPMYGEVPTRGLTVNVQAAVPPPTWRWRRDDGSLHDALLERLHQVVPVGLTGATADCHPDDNEASWADTPCP